MTTSPSRRDILTSTIALAAGAALPSLGHVSSAMADSSSPTAAEIVAAIRDKKMTATSAVRAALDRAEQLKDLNAFIILNRDGALAAAARSMPARKPGRWPVCPSWSRTTSIPLTCRLRAARRRCKMRGPRRMRHPYRNCWMPAPSSSARQTCMSSLSASPAPIFRHSQGR